MVGDDLTDRAARRLAGLKHIWLLGGLSCARAVRHIAVHGAIGLSCRSRLAHDRGDQGKNEETKRQSPHSQHILLRPKTLSMGRKYPWVT